MKTTTNQENFDKAISWPMHYLLNQMSKFMSLEEFKQKLEASQCIKVEDKAKLLKDFIYYRGLR